MFLLSNQSIIHLSIFILSIFNENSWIVNELPDDSNYNYDSATLNACGCRMFAVRELSTARKREKDIGIFIT